MITDVPPSMSQNGRSSRYSFGSSNGNGDTPAQNGAAVINVDDYDSDSSNFAPPWVSSFLLDILKIWFPPLWNDDGHFSFRKLYLFGLNLVYLLFQL